MSLQVGFDVTPLLGQPTGVGVVTKGFFDRLGHRTDVTMKAFAMTAHGLDRLNDLSPAGIRRNRLPMPAAPLARLWLRRDEPKLERWIGPVDIAHGTNFVVPPTNKASLVTVHDLTAVRFPEMCSPHSLRYPDLVRQAVKRGAHVHTFSEFVQREVVELLGVAEHRVHVVKPGVETMIDASAPELIQAPYVLAVGTVEPRKNYPRLIEAFDRVADAQPDIRLAIAGGRGWGFEQLQQTIAGAKHGNRIFYAGRVTDAERVRLMKNAEMLVYPSSYEGFGMPPLEAMTVETPVVTTNAGSVPETVGDAAVVVDANDVDQLADAIQRVLTDELLRVRLVTAGRKHVRNFDWQKSTDRLITLYRELAS